VRIEPPYAASDCTSLDGDDVAYQRILKILVAAKAAAAAGAPAAAAAAAAAAKMPPGN
jgi:ribosomal protein L12E/L44/L45/RPP1/RPP2